MAQVISSFALGPVDISVLDAVDPAADDSAVVERDFEIEVTSEEESFPITYEEFVGEGGAATRPYEFVSDPENGLTKGVCGYYHAFDGRSLEMPTRFSLLAANREARHISIRYPAAIRGFTRNHFWELLIGISNYLHETYRPNEYSNMIERISLVLGDEDSVEAWRLGFMQYCSDMHDVVECMEATNRVRQYPALEKKYTEKDAAVMEYFQKNADAEEDCRRVFDLLNDVSRRVAQYLVFDVFKAGRLVQLRGGRDQRLFELMLKWTAVYTAELRALSSYKLEMGGFVALDDLRTFIDHQRGLKLVQFNTLNEKQQEAAARLMLKRMRDAAKGMTQALARAEQRQQAQAEEVRRKEAQETVARLASLGSQRRGR